MPSLKKVLSFRKRMYEHSSGLVETKGADYNYKQQKEGDTLYNLKASSLLGIVDLPESGVLVRLADKLMRLISLSQKATPAVEGESAYDTVADIHNYADFVLLLMEERRERDEWERHNYFFDLENTDTGDDDPFKEVPWYEPYPQPYEKDCPQCGQPFIAGIEDEEW